MASDQKRQFEDALIVSPPMRIEPAWIDYNGHLNMAYYSVLFDRAFDGVCEELGLGPDYAETRKMTTYTGEIHLRYVRELHLDHAVVGSFQLVDFNEKSMHTYQELRHVDGWLAATCEAISLHVDMTGPRVVPYPSDVMVRIQNLSWRQSDLPRPEAAGARIGIRRKRAKGGSR